MNVPKIAILAPVPEYEEDWSHIKADYTRLLGDQATFIDWTKADDLSGFDLVTPLLAWGYPRDCPRWFALLDRLEADGIAVSNPVSILRWNSDKSYLAELDAAGIPSVPTLESDALDAAALDHARATSAARAARAGAARAPSSRGEQRVAARCALGLAARRGRRGRRGRRSCRGGPFSSFFVFFFAAAAAREQHRLRRC
jgi:hypothetical protein